MPGAVVADLANNPVFPVPTVDLKTVRLPPMNSMRLCLHGLAEGRPEKRKKRQAPISLLRKLPYWQILSLTKVRCRQLDSHLEIGPQAPCTRLILILGQAPSSEYVVVEGRVCRSKHRPLVRGLNRNYSRALKSVFKSAAKYPAFSSGSRNRIDSKEIEPPRPSGMFINWPEW